jgi:hypothetical protein
LQVIAVAMMLLCVLFSGSMAEQVTIERLRSENSNLRSDLADARAEIERLRAQLRAQPSVEDAEAIMDSLRNRIDLHEEVDYDADVGRWHRPRTRIPTRKNIIKVPIRRRTEVHRRTPTRKVHRPRARTPIRKVITKVLRSRTKVKKTLPAKSREPLSIKLGTASGHWGGLNKTLLVTNVFEAFKTERITNCFESRKTPGGCQKKCKVNGKMPSKNNCHCSRHWVQHPQCKAKCPNHCKGDCMTEIRVVDKQCLPREGAMKNIRNHYLRLCDSVKDCTNEPAFEHTRRKECAFGHAIHGGGKWMVNGRREVWKDNLKRAPPCDKKGEPQWWFHTGETVKCPCNGADGKTLSTQEALYNILGQLAQIGIPPVVAAQTATGTTKGGGWNIMTGYATFLMIECWKKKCAPERLSQPDQEELRRSVGTKTDLASLLLDASDSTNDAGWNAC